MIAEREPANSSMGVAALLRETRIKLGRDIGVAATTLRIRQPYLQAIEDGRFEDLPGSTYAVGFVRGYAEYLGLDGLEIVRRFKQENSELSGRAELVFPSATSGGGIPTGALLGIAVVGAAIAYGAWVWLQDRHETVAEAVPPLPERLAALIHKPVDAPAETAPAPSPAAAPAPAPVEQAPAATVTQETTAALPQPPVSEPPPPAPAAEVAPPAPQPEPAPAVAAAPEPAKPVKAAKAKKTETPAPTPAPTVADGDNPGASAVMTAAAETLAAAAPPPKPEKPVWKPSKHVQIRASADSWIKIRTADGQTLVSRLMKAGSTLAPPDLPGLVMIVGNAGALNLVVDGQERPPLGPLGMVKHVGLDGGGAEESSTPTETPSPANGPNE